MSERIKEIKYLVRRDDCNERDAGVDGPIGYNTACYNTEDNSHDQYTRH